MDRSRIFDRARGPPQRCAMSSPRDRHVLHKDASCLLQGSALFPHKGAPISIRRGACSLTRERPVCTKESPVLFRRVAHCPNNGANSPSTRAPGSSPSICCMVPHLFNSFVKHHSVCVTALFPPELVISMSPPLPGSVPAPFVTIHNPYPL